MQCVHRAVTSLGSAVLLMLLGTTSASAATATVVAEQGPEGAISRLDYRAEPGERNLVEVRLEKKDEVPSAYLLSGDPAPIAPGCTPFVPPGPMAWLRCPVSEGTRLGAPRIRLGDADDIALMSRELGPATIFGHNGNDDLVGAGFLDGGPGDDELFGVGRAGVRIVGGPGSDFLAGGPGADVIAPGSGPDQILAGFGDDDVVTSGDGRSDYIVCGPGNDRASLDGYDLPAWAGCERLSRIGAPRAVAEPTDNLDSTYLTVYVTCPIDFRGVCRALVRARSVQHPRLRGSAHVRIGPGRRTFVELWGYGEDGDARITVLTLRDHRRPLRARTTIGYSYYGGE